MVSKVWLIPWSVSAHCCFESSIIVFDQEVTERQAQDQVSNYANLPKEDRISHKNILEIIDSTPAEEASILQAMRSIYG